MRKAIIIGSGGQDGQIAWEKLSQMGYDLIGIDKNSVKNTNKLNTSKKPIDILNAQPISELIDEIKPNEVYYLAAYHQSSQTKIDTLSNALDQGYKIHVSGLINFLQAIKDYSPKTKLFYASSCLIYADTDSLVQNEATCPKPNSSYGITKLAGQLTCELFRKEGLFASVGILYNHESEYRPEQFLSQKVVHAAVDIKLGRKPELELGSLDTKVDWGYAPDYVDAMQLILNMESPDEFIISSGETHTIQELVQIAFDEVGIKDWKNFVKVNENIIKSNKRKTLQGDSSKLIRATKWERKTSFEEMIRKMVQVYISNMK